MHPKPIKIEPAKLPLHILIERHVQFWRWTYLLDIRPIVSQVRRCDVDLRCLGPARLSTGFWLVNLLRLLGLLGAFWYEGYECPAIRDPHIAGRQLLVGNFFLPTGRDSVLVGRNCVIAASLKCLILSFMLVRLFRALPLITGRESALALDSPGVTAILEPLIHLVRADPGGLPSTLIKQLSWTSWAGHHTLRLSAVCCSLYVSTTMMLTSPSVPHFIRWGLLPTLLQTINAFNVGMNFLAPLYLMLSYTLVKLAQIAFIERLFESRIRK